MTAKHYPPAYPNSYLPALSVITSETTGSRPLFFAYNSGAGSYGALLDSGACGSFTQMCLDLGSGSASYTALENAGTTLKVGGGDDGNFTAITLGAPATVTGSLTSTGLSSPSLTSTGALAVTSAASTALTLTGNAASTLSTTAGAITIQSGSGNVILAADGASSGNIQIGTGNGGTGTSTPDLLVLDDNSTTTDPTGVAGAMYFNSVTQSFRCYQNTAWVNCGGSLLKSNTSVSTAVNTCTTACAAFSTYSSIPANFCQPGRVITLVAYGIYSTTANTTLQMGVYMGTNTTTKTSDTLLGSASGAVSSGAARTNVGFRVQFSIICDTIGAPGTINGQGVFTLDTTTTASTLSGMYTNGTTSVTNNGATDILLFPAFGASNAGDTATIEQMIVTSQ